MASLNINYLLPSNSLPQCLSWSGNSRSSFLTRKPNPNPNPNRIITCSSKPKMSPWLMLPPSLNRTNDVYDFYRLDEDKVVSFNKKKCNQDKVDFVGSSHGWIISFKNNSKNSNLFLTNPLLDSHIKLPSPYHLPLPRSHIENVVVSSPDPGGDDDCRAVMSYNSGKNLAFCCPKNSVEWTPFGDFRHEYGLRYCSTVFSATQKLFFCFTKLNVVEAWDLSDLNSPIKIPMKGEVPLFKQRRKSSLTLIPTPYLAVDDVSDDLYTVIRYSNRPEYKTVYFDVYKYDKKAGEWKYMDHTLDDMAIFVGINHGFVLRAADYPNLKYDAVYFTDDIHGRDMGIFNYQSDTFSPCYEGVLPCFWFTPNLSFVGEDMESYYSENELRLISL